MSKYWEEGRKIIYEEEEGFSEYALSLARKENKNG